MRRLAVRGCAVAALAAGVAGVLPAVASAAPVSCATPPAAYSGSDAVVAQLVALQVDEDVDCKAVTDRLDEIGTSDTSVATTVGGWTAASPLEVALPSAGGSSGQPVSVTNWPADQTVGLDSTSAGQLDGNAQSEHGDLWVLIGAVVGVFVFDVLLRRIWP